MYCLSFISMIKKVRTKFDYKDEDLEDNFFKCSFLFFIQSLIIVCVLYSALNNEDDNEYVKPDFSNMTLRILCCYLFHLSTYGDVSSSFKRLKFLR